MSRRSLGLVIAVSVLAATIVSLTPARLPADAAAISAFRIAYRTQVNGGVVFAQNSSLTCSPTRASRQGVDAPGCDMARTGAGKLTNNNQWIMTHVDIDDDPTTYNSSAGDLNLPAGAQVVYAALYWGAYRKGADGQPGAPANIGAIKLKVPGAPDYLDLQAAATDIIAPPSSVDSELPYQATVVVTDVVRAAGAGRYTVANLPAALGGNRYAGWTLATVFEDPNRPLRDITLFDGLSVVRKTDPSDIIEISGFRAPVEGAVDATVGIVAYDGDRGTAGDYARFNGVTLTSPQSPATNFFNSTIDTFGSLVTSREPSPVNNFGFDVKVADATGILANGATSARIELGTVGETIYVGLVSTRIDLTAPRFPPIKSVVNLTGHEPAQPGDVLRYRMTVTNKGDDPADMVVVTDSIPAGTTYVAGSLTVDGDAVTDDTGDDVGEVVDGIVTVRVGEGANATDGGRVGLGTSTTVTFDVTIDETSAGRVLDNTGRLAYRAVTLERDLTTPTNTVLTPVAAEEAGTPPAAGRPVLQISQAAPERVPAGDIIHYDLTVRNKGDADAIDSTATFTLPPGVMVVAMSDDCTVTEAVVTCVIGMLAPGGVWFGELDVRVDRDVAPETALNSVGRATAQGADPAESSVRTRVSGDSSLAVQVDMTPLDPASPPEPVTLDVIVTNEDSGTGTDVTALVVIPGGWSLDDGDHGCEVNSDHPEVASCQLGDVAGGGSSSLSLTVSPGADAAAHGEVFVKVTSSDLDRRPDDNVVTQPISLSESDRGELPATGRETTVWLMAAIALLLAGAAMARSRPGLRQTSGWNRL